MEFSEIVLSDETDLYCPKIYLHPKNRFGDFIQSWGNAASMDLFVNDYEIFTAPNIEGMIGYHKDGSCAHVFGDPLCANQDIPSLTCQFHQFCKEKRLSVVYLTASHTFAKWAMGHLCNAMLETKEELNLDPSSFPISTKKASDIRNSINLGGRKEVAIHEYSGEDKALEIEMQEEAKIGLFAQRKGKRWFYACQGKKVIGALLLQNLMAKEGWQIEDIRLASNAPLGTIEQLVIGTLKSLQKEGCRYLGLGIAQKQALGETRGFGLIEEYLLRLSFKILRKASKQRFVREFLPQKEPLYVLFSEPEVGVKKIQSIIRALYVS